MKTIKILCLVLAFFVANKSQAQFVHSNTFAPENKHTLHVNLAWDYGLVYELGYSYQLKSTLPLRLHASYSFPSGGTIFDDIKTRIGAQARLWKSGNIQAHLGLYGLYRQFENPLATLRNFGSEVNARIGYFRPRWFVGGEIGFDKAIVTQFKHKAIFRDNIYSAVKDGWYQASSGGNLYYGLQGGFSFRRSSLALSIGQVRTEALKTTPLVPLYFQVGYQRTFE